MSDFAEFDKYVADNNIKDGELGAAFAAWLNLETGWDGKVARLEVSEMSEEYTPTTDVVRIHYSDSEMRICAITRDSANTEFDRWLASHDLELRERIAREIEGEIAEHETHNLDGCASCWANDDFRKAAEIARGKKDE